MPVGLFLSESQNLPFDVSAAPTAPSLFQGTGAAIGGGVEEGFAETGIGIAGAAEAARSKLLGIASDISGGVRALENFRMPTAYGPLAPAISPGTDEVQDVSQDETQRQNAIAQQAYLSKFRADPQTTGAGAQVLHSLVSGLVRMGIGGVVGGPVGAAGVVGATQGYDTQQQLLAAGVSGGTAETAGMMQGVAAGVGALLPGGYGKTLLQRIATGGFANVGQGILSRTAMSSILDNAGYHDMAQQYRPLDAQATVADLVLGFGFGAMHHVMAPATTDAAHSILDAKHVEESAPGVPVDLESRQAAVANHDAATQALLNGDDMPPMQDVRTVPNPAQEAAGSDFAAGLTDVASEHGIDLTDVSARSGESRQDAVDAARMWAKAGLGGTTRYYHGGNPENVTGPLWFSRELSYAQGYAEKSQGKVWYVDVPNDHPFFALARQDQEEFGVLPPSNVELPAEIALKRKVLLGERRQDAVDAARMAELRDKGLSNLTPAETAEYANLLEADRLAAKVGGRRIAGLLSREAYEEQVAAGKQLPHVGYFDLDMFKDINDKAGSHVGDDVIRATGEAAATLFGEGNAFKGSERAGDEFMVQGNSPEEIQSKIDALRQYMSNHTIQAYDKDGNLVYEQKGVNFSHGIGKDATEAEAAAKLEKQRRAALGLRANRGAGAEKPAAEGSARAGTETAGPTAKARLIRPVDQLAKSLEALRESNGTDEKAHAQVRAVLKSVAESGGDTAAVERAAVERAGQGAGAVLGAAKAAEHAAVDVSGLDPETASIVEAAHQALAEGDIVSRNEDTGQEYSLREELQRAVEDARQAKTDGTLLEVAAACGARA